MATINVLIAVDAATLAQQVKDGSIKPGSERVPTSLSSYVSSNVYLVMITQGDILDNFTLGQRELQMKCNESDNVQWTITSFANNFDHSVFLYKVRLRHSVAKVSYNSSQANNYLPAPGGGSTIGEVTEYKNQVATVQTGVASQYSLLFQLVDNANGNILGYFEWDTSINIS
jgi:nematocidal protein AidA